jgi:pimeloyl-ACP methyl ester carboxylesterase
MQRVLIGIVRNLAAAALFAVALGIQFAAAQSFPEQEIPGTPAADFARYYAPYAIQAGAAYIPVQEFNARPAPSEHQDYVVQYLAGTSIGLSPLARDERKQFVARATKYLRPWRYQFGSQGYITCLYADPDCLKAIKRDDAWTYKINGGPSFHVWARFPNKEGAACSEVSIAFKGTIFTSYADWVANAVPRWFRADDHYRQLRRNIDAIVNKITELPCYRRAGSTQIVTVGHSLGGGLAQFAGLANKRIKKVFAFDPSPVTGANLLDKKLREQNADHLEIDRIYQSAEVLAWVRPFIQQFPAASSPCVRTVPFDVSQPINVIGLHSMNGLARGIVQASYERGGRQRSFAVPGPTGCPRGYPDGYTPPETDEDDYEAPAPGLISSRGVRFSRANPVRATVAYAHNRGLEFTSARAMRDWSAVNLTPETLNGMATADTRRRQIDRHVPHTPLAINAALPQSEMRHMRF